VPRVAVNRPSQDVFGRVFHGLHAPVADVPYEGGFVQQFENERGIARV
jgi:hypothetical protein